MLVLYIFLGLGLIIILLAVTAKKSYRVSRSILIQKPAAQVFEYLKYLKNQDEWSPWERKDPNMKKSYKGIDGEPGFISRWEGNKDVGIGEQELKAIEPGKRVESELRFLKPFKSTSDAWLKVSTPNPGITEVEWGFTGENTFPFSIMSHFVSMDKMIGKDFEEGLQNLKERLEEKE